MRIALNFFKTPMANTQNHNTYTVGPAFLHRNLFNSVGARTVFSVFIAI
jgi:hypothetical protein